MAQYEHTQLVYTARNAGIQYIDLTRGLALINAKNCSQFDDKDKPLVAVGTIRMTNAGQTVNAIKNTWPVRNACVKALAAWRRTLKSAGVRRKKQLNTYSRVPRFAMTYKHTLTWSAVTASAADIVPQGVDAYYATGIYTSGGDEITVYAINADPTGLTPWNSQNQQAFSQTTFAVPQSGATDVLDKKVNVLGDLDATYCNVVAEYIDSRINDADTLDTDMEDTPTIDNDFVMMLAPGEEVADDVLDNIDDEGKWRPYTLHTSTSSCPVITPAANVAGQDTFFEAPLGLLEWTPDEIGDELVINIALLVEM